MSMLTVVLKSALFLWIPASSVQSSTAWQLSTMKDLTHKAGELFIDGRLYWDYTQKETESGCGLLRAKAE